MFRLLCGVSLLALFVSAVTAADDDTVTFKDYKAKVGERTRSTEEERATTRTVIVRDGKREDKVEKKSKVVIYVSEVLAVKAGEKKPTRVQRTYEKAEETGEDGTEKMPLHGKTVVIEKKGDKYAFTDADGKRLPEAAEAVLKKEFEKKTTDDAFDKLIPRRPLKSGETWKLELDDIVKEMTNDTFTVDKKKVAGTGTLARVYSFAGHRYGEFELSMNIPLTAMTGATPIDLKPGSTMKLSVHGDGNVEGTEPDGVATMRMTMVMLFDVPDGTASIRVDALMTMATETLPPRKRD